MVERVIKLESLLQWVIGLSILIFIDCSIDIPNVDIPDLKDVSPKDLINLIIGGQ